MPTVLELDGFSIRIYLPPREHPPAHVHVIRGAGELIVLLGDANTPPVIREVHGMADHEALKAYRIVETHRASLVAAWRKYHE